MAEDRGRFVERGIPVMGISGLSRSRSTHSARFAAQGPRGGQAGGADRQKRTPGDFRRPGAFSVVIEAAPKTVGQEDHRKNIAIPTIGISAPVRPCDVRCCCLEDMLGLSAGVARKFVRSYGDRVP